MLRPTHNEFNPRLVLAAALLLLPLFAAPACAETAAVLTAAAGPYQEAYAAFLEDYGGPVRLYDLATSAAAPQQEKLIVAFGGKAAVRDYPGASVLIYCLAPGITGPVRTGWTVAISMMPAPDRALKTLQQLQPGLKKLAVFYGSDAYAGYVGLLIAEGQRLGVEVVRAKAPAGDAIPAELRRLHRSMDAFWLLADPLIVNSDNFSTLRNFSRANGIPFYAPTAGLARKGATAAIYNSFREIGRTAARVAKEGVQGNALRYPESVQYSINAGESAYIGLKIPSEVEDKAEALFQ